MAIARCARPVVVLLALLSAAAPALAWNDTGHTAIDLIAYRQLSPEVRGKLSEILRAHPAYETDLLKGMPAGAEKDEFAFSRAGVWPDMIRGREHPMFTYHRGTWHYTNVPYFPEGGEAKFKIESPAPMKPGEPYDSISAWEWNLRRLGNEALPMADRAVALCWVLHLGGDSHQPLHAVSLFSDAYPAGDKGGNDQLVQKDGRNLNLHALWDGGLGLDREAAGAVAEEAVKKHPRAEFGEAAKVSDIRVWSQEGRELCISTVYAAQTVKKGQGNTPAVEGTVVPAVSEEYLKKMSEVCLSRAALGGYRLADALQKTVGSPAAADGMAKGAPATAPASRP